MGRLVWDSDRAGSVDIWMLDAGAAELQQITTDEATDRIATLSADGTLIVFTSDRNGGPDSPTGLRSYALFSITPGDSEPQHLLGTRTFNSSAIYSPDGSQIAFSSDAEGNQQVFLMKADGSGSPARLTEDPVQAEMGDWSPDGSRIVFTSYRDSTGCSETPRGFVACTGYNREIYVMDADGGDPVRLTDDPADDGAPAWSPDGSQIVFHSDRFGNDDIYVMNVDGSDVRQLSSSPAAERFPTWSPDGLMIAFDYFLDEDNDDIYLMNADGTGVVNLTNSPSRDAFPDWGALPE
jgi:Tol biopolymer transport system component